MKFLFTLDTVKRPDQKCDQAEQEGCFKECLYRRISYRATRVLRGAYLRQNVSIQIIFVIKSNKYLAHLIQIYNFFI